MKKIIMVLIAGISTFMQASDPGIRYQPIAAPVENANSALNTYKLPSNPIKQRSGSPKRRSQQEQDTITYTILNEGNESYKVTIVSVDDKDTPKHEWEGKIPAQKQTRVRHKSDPDDNTVTIRIDSKSRRKKQLQPFIGFITPKEESIIVIRPYHDTLAVEDIAQ